MVVLQVLALVILVRIQASQPSCDTPRDRVLSTILSKKFENLIPYGIEIRTTRAHETPSRRGHTG